LVRRPLTGLFYQPRMIDDDCGAVGRMRIGRGNRSSRRKPVPSATSSTTSPTSLDLGSNPGLRGGKPATNRLSYGTAFSCTLLPIHVRIELPCSTYRVNLITVPINFQCNSFDRISQCSAEQSFIFGRSQLRMLTQAFPCSSKKLLEDPALKQNFMVTRPNS
jgi:hypothetical protein